MMEYDIRFRKKGKIVTASNFVLPETLTPKGTERGVDLTRYSVFLVRGREKFALEFRKKLNVDIVANIDKWTGAKLFLKENFDPSKVSFYKPSWQLSEEENAAKERQAKELLEEVRKMLDLEKFEVELSYNNHSVIVSPRGWKVWGSGCWGVTVSSTEETVTRVNEALMHWEGWRDRITNLLNTVESDGFSSAEFLRNDDKIVEILYRPKSYKGPMIFTKKVDAVIENDGSLRPIKTYTHTGSVWLPDRK
jgi:hypothetical protein